MVPFLIVSLQQYSCFPYDSPNELYSSYELVECYVSVIAARKEVKDSSETCSFSVNTFCFLLCCHIKCPLPLFFFSIMGVLSNKCGFQLQYQMIFSIWLLAFSPQMCEHLRRYNIIPVLSDILQESVKEKVTRIILAAFRVSTQRGKVVVCMGITLFCRDASLKGEK